MTPPVIINGTARLSKGMSTSTHLTYTLFDRLSDMFGDDITKMLCIQYRMHKNIMRFSSNELYGKKLVAGIPNSTHLLRDLPKIKSTKYTKSSIMVIDTSDTGKALESQGKGINKQSTANDYEAQLAIRYVKKLLDEGLTENQIGIITPYTAQVSQLLTAMGERWQDIEVGSVDGFQGREKEAIILTLVRSNNRGEVGFLSEKRRLNGKYFAKKKKLKQLDIINSVFIVAMTRARRHLAIICDMKTLNGPKNGSRRARTSKSDRNFLAKWMQWLNNEAFVQYSQSLKNIPA
jgi:DNA polymerase alpha-associated DNA helicase A